MWFIASYNEKDIKMFFFVWATVLSLALMGVKKGLERWGYHLPELNNCCYGVLVLVVAGGLLYYLKKEPPPDTPEAPKKPHKPNK